MYVASSKQMKEIDKRAIEEYGIPSIVLMENAAASVLKYIKKYNASRIIVLCGTGNNGGDGFAIARLLHINGYYVSVYCFGDYNKISGDAKVNFDILNKLNIDVKSDIERFISELENCDLIIDAILGTGFKGEISGKYKDAIENVNRSGKYVISVDIPSGIESDTGKASKVHIKADITVTFGCLKYGHILNEGRNSSKRVYVENISIPKSCIEDEKIKAVTNYDKYPLSLLKKRGIDTNKSDYGRLFIIGGSFNMSGAVCLCAKAALRTGSGLVSCVIPKGIADRVGALVPEATYVLCEEKDGFIDIKKEQLDEIIQRADVIALGIGLGNSEKLIDMIEYLIENSTKPLVIDADGLNILSRNNDILKNAKSRIVITPHPGEMARLTGFSTNYINENRVKIAIDFSREYNCITLLKGSSTVVAFEDNIYINTTGNPGMATGGSGDVLTGIIASFIGQGYTPYEACILGSYIHGRAGDDAYETYGYGLTSKDIIKFIGKYVKL
ncbi:NAD(P)H-hydrate epimerase [Caloramator quimbayensis]|uniref:Bifunctional NAD(P)H-hydrate repair enzyme n=1 Tax=Caloramator quimbayensis TaxID=1147123 RepID=A0A1T4XEQ8_9CLOT|nr:NAD(P)H-hydrate dehydratase [Caloramator quimbayensis]SKA87959.1 NAD(P)H-hydrate epimerase [Caloramator quimbayensis]